MQLFKFLFYLLLCYVYKLQDQQIDIPLSIKAYRYCIIDLFAIVWLLMKSEENKSINENKQDILQ